VGSIEVKINLDRELQASSLVDMSPGLISTIMHGARVTVRKGIEPRESGSSGVNWTNSCANPIIENSKKILKINKYKILKIDFVKSFISYLF
jgi:hypothetical protein